jgi:hypothetical protein
MKYIANTQTMDVDLDITTPHIIIDKSTRSWYYFLDKYAYRNKYKFHYVDSTAAANSLIQRIRKEEVGAQFWYIINNPKELSTKM